jgi:exonuclease VII large subunit
LERLCLFCPGQVPARGYSITMDAASGKVLRNAIKVKAGQKLKTPVGKGRSFELRRKVRNLAGHFCQK